eukprot:COSAG01_NODE_5850_length_3994_cov_5.826958_3_plen_112_part_00
MCFLRFLGCSFDPPFKPKRIQKQLEASAKELAKEHVDILKLMESEDPEERAEADQINNQVGVMRLNLGLDCARVHVRGWASLRRAVAGNYVPQVMLILETSRPYDLTAKDW